MLRTVLQDARVAGVDCEAFSVRWSADDSHIAAAMGDGTVRLYTADGNFVRRLNCRVTPEAMPATSIRWRPGAVKSAAKEVLACVTSNGAIMHWLPHLGKEVHRTVLENTQCLCLDYAPDGTAYAVGCNDFIVRVFDEGTHQLKAQLLPHAGDRIGHSNRVFSVKWIDAFTLASGGWDDNVLVWDMRTNAVVRSLFGPHICGDSIDVRGSVLLIGAFSNREQVTQWNYAEDQKLHSMTLQCATRPCMAYAAQYSKSDNGFFFAIGGSGGDECHFYTSDEATCYAVRPEDPAVFSMDHSHSDLRLALGRSDGSIEIVHTANQS